MNSFKRANDRQSKFVWNEIWKGLLSPGTILTLSLYLLTLYSLSKCTNFYTMPSKFDTDNYSPIHYPKAFHTLYK